MLAAQLQAALERIGIPVVGVSIGQLDDRSTWRIDYDDPTIAQQLAGDELLASFDPDNDEDYLEERAESEATAFLKKPSTQSFLVVMAGFFDAQVVDVQENLKAAYKQAYKDEHSLP
jgi:hypothetical protein